MEGHEEEPAIALGFIARATRLITRLGRHQARRHRPNPALLQIDSSGSDEDYIPGEEEDEDEEEEDPNEESGLFDVTDSEESSQSLGTRAMSSGSDGSEALLPVDHAIAQSTALRHSPSEGSARLGNVKRGGRVNVMTMLAGREFNVSGNGRFSRAECCHVGARFLPTDGPSVVERLNSRAYIGQFSGDGTLFVAGFQVRFQSMRILFASLQAF